MVGCSPDARVGEEGLLELKCPMLKTHLFWLNRSHLTERALSYRCKDKFGVADAPSGVTS